MRSLALASVAVSLTLASACAHDQKARAPLAGTAPAPAAAKVAKAAPARSPGATVSAGPDAPTAPIYFEFDSDQLTSDAQNELQQMATYLNAHAGAKLTIEGHCDELGSEEYNLALGDRRARAAVKYLKKLGVDPTRLNSISYGEERPAVAGDDDAARAKNRRGEFDLKG